MSQSSIATASAAAEDWPIPVIGPFSELNDHLLVLLRDLAPDDWQRPTVCSEWSVKDIASHLLDGNIRRLSAHRDGYIAPQVPAVFDSQADLVAYLTRLNAEWTAATHRISPQMLIELLDFTGPAVADFFATLDPYGPALYPVGWAGEAMSRNWFDVAREYTERWHHQRQIIDAVGRPSPIDTHRLYHVVLDTFMRALPFTFQEVRAGDGALLRVTIAGDAGGDWFLQEKDHRWELLRRATGSPRACVTIGQDTAWRLFTKRMDRRTALARFADIQLEGDTELGGRVLEMVSIMA